MTLPEYIDARLDAAMPLASFGWARVVGPTGWCGGRLELAIEADGLRVYDVWVMRGGEWAQLRRDGAHWIHEGLDAEVRDVRFWIAPLEPSVAPPDEAPAPEVETAALPPYVAIAEGEPPLPSERRPLPSRLMRWVHGRADDLLVDAMLDEWTQAAAEAAALGWMCGMPAGEDLLLAYARSPGASERAVGHEAAFARWLTARLGQRICAGLEERRDAESRRAGVGILVDSLGRLVRALDPGLRIEPTPPSVVGPRERHRWLVDEPLAARLDNPIHGGAHRPVFALRPLLLSEQGVLLEGLVA